MSIIKSTHTNKVKKYVVGQKVKFTESQVVDRFGSTGTILRVMTTTFIVKFPGCPFPVLLPFPVLSNNV